MNEWMNEWIYTTTWEIPAIWLAQSSGISAELKYLDVKITNRLRVVV